MSFINYFSIIDRISKITHYLYLILAILQVSIMPCKFFIDVYLYFSC